MQNINYKPEERLIIVSGILMHCNKLLGMRRVAFRNWKKYGNGIAYDHDIRFVGDSVLHCNRRERPQLVIENNKITCLKTAVYDGKNSWCQPLLLDQPIDIKNK